MIDLIDWINGALWDVLLIVVLSGMGIYLSIRLNFIQFRKFGESFKKTFVSISLKGDKASAEDGMTSFQSLATSISAQIGTGNLAGVATAMVSGGPGAVFWMWLSAILGMAIIYAEATLAQYYRTTEKGHLVGGPVYYIQAAFQGRLGKVIAALFSVLLIFALGFMGNMVQANSVGHAVSTAFGISPWITGIVMAIMALMVFIGGVERIASVTEKIVPLMALFFTIASFIVIIMNVENVPASFEMIFVGAFNPDAVLGGILGVSIQQAIRFGVSRGLFTHEAGMGSTPHAHALARVKHPSEQGLVAMMGVFIDTIVLLPMTVLVILTTGVLDGATTGIELTQLAYAQVFGKWGYVIVAISVFFFAFATIIGWYFFGHANVKYLFGKRAIPIYSVLVAVFIAIGSGLHVELVWSLADLFNGLMVLPNIISIFLLTNVVVKITKDYDLPLSQQQYQNTYTKK